MPVPVTRMPITATARARADAIFSYINTITLSGRTLKYPSNSSAEEQALQWLMEDVLGPDVDDEQSLQQRYVLVILWFLQPLTDFGMINHETALTSIIDECEWPHVECDGNGYVTALYMGDAYVRGQIPPDLGLLTHLTFLNLSNNQLFGTIPSSLGTLTALSDLWLQNNQLRGTIPSSLGILTALIQLYLYDNLLSGTIPSSLGALTALISLSLERNHLSGTIPSSLGTLTALDVLWLRSNQLSRTIPSSLGALPAMASLLLNNNQLVGTMPFCNSDQAFASLVADCMEVDCTCCTECCPVAFGNIMASSFCDD
jgi:hypothetical protein